MDEPPRDHVTGADVLNDAWLALERQRIAQAHRDRFARGYHARTPYPWPTRDDREARHVAIHDPTATVQYLVNPGHAPA